MRRRDPYPRNMSGRATYHRRALHTAGLLARRRDGPGGGRLRECAYGVRRFQSELEASRKPRSRQGRRTVHHYPEGPFALAARDPARTIHRRPRRGVEVEGHVSGRFPGHGGCIQPIPDRRQLHGTDPMGLVWSAYGNGTSYAISLHPQPLFITAESGGETAHVEVSRNLLTEKIACTDVRERGLYGRFFQPASGGPVPGVLVLGGSEGGLASYVMREAALLASHGFAALAYFYMGSLPDRLAGIPLEYFGDAIRWLQDQPSVRGDRLGVIGTSRGGELALLLGAHYPDLAAVVSYVGSGLVFPHLRQVPNQNGPSAANRCPGSPTPSISCRPIQSGSKRPRYRSSAPTVPSSLSPATPTRFGRPPSSRRSPWTVSVATHGLTATSFVTIPTPGTGFSHPTFRPPQEPITTAEISLATPPPTRIPGGACSACSMDVYGVLALRRPAKTCIAFEWPRMPTPHLFTLSALDAALERFGHRP
jgi:BAAT / Acyl-CoA thioester hydrolase C terminal